ncbi:lamin tail domain-containing protein, partial [Noviherbaspirillum denitrificans]
LPLKRLAALSLAIGITSCGGGGSPDAASSDTSGAVGTALPSAPVPLAAPMQQASITRENGSLLIDEISTGYYSNDVVWIEVVNTSMHSISLHGYTLRSSHIDSATGVSTQAPAEFPLPDVTLAPGAHLVIASKTSDALVDNAQMVYVKNGNARPFWSDSGSVELVRDGATADFVRFGTSVTMPMSPEAWSGDNVAALPSGPEEHGKSIVRLAARGVPDTDSAADWSLVNFATPAGLNDIAPGVIDSDRDGIPDSAKRAGGTYGGLDLYAMGARPGRRDIFLEIDYMDGNDVATRPRREALQKMEHAFAVKGIAMHMDTGALHGQDAAAYNLGGGNSVSFAPCIELDTSTDGAGARDGCTSFQAVKNRNMDVRRRLLFHYALFANSLNTDGSAGPSGISEMSGNDLIISLGGYDFQVDTDTGRNMLINMQASTLMHEFGHNLGLHHGGNEDVNYKPNHYSVMNYMYQFAGLSATPDSVYAAERYYLANGLKGITYCGLTENSPCSDGFLMSYSDGSSVPLDEARLSEADNIGRGSSGGAYADWDNNGVRTGGTVAKNINPLGGFGRTVLRDYDEWGNLQIAFSRGFSGSSSGRSLREPAPSRQFNAMNPGHPFATITEDALPEGVKEMIRSGRRWRR